VEENKKWIVDKARHKYKDIKNGSNKSEDGEK
jgi:hypothetical protein